MFRILWDDCLWSQQGMWIIRLISIVIFPYFTTDTINIWEFLWTCFIPHRLWCRNHNVGVAYIILDCVQGYYRRDVQDCQQRLSSAFDLLLIFLCSLIQTLTLTPPPNNVLLANLDMYRLQTDGYTPRCELKDLCRRRHSCDIPPSFLPGAYERQSRFAHSANNKN